MEAEEEEVVEEEEEEELDRPSKRPKYVDVSSSEAEPFEHFRVTVRDARRLCNILKFLQCKVKGKANEPTGHQLTLTITPTGWEIVTWSPDRSKMVRVKLSPLFFETFEARKPSFVLTLPIPALLKQLSRVHNSSQKMIIQDCKQGVQLYCTNMTNVVNALEEEKMDPIDLDSMSFRAVLAVKAEDFVHALGSTEGQILQLKFDVPRRVLTVQSESDTGSTSVRVNLTLKKGPPLTDVLKNGLFNRVALDTLKNAALEAELHIGVPESNELICFFYELEHDSKMSMWLGERAEE